MGVPGGAVVAVLVVVALVAVLGWGLWELRSEASRRRRWVLGALRAGTVLAGLAVVLQPRWVGERVRHEQGRLAVIFDGSRSMSVAAGERSRADRARELAERWADGAGAERASVHVFGGDTRASELSRLAESYPQRDDETRIGGAIESLARGDDGNDLGAVVVVSDGADSGNPSPERIERLGVRVHAVAVAEDEPIRDDAIARVEADPVGFLRQPAEVRVEVRSTGGDQETIPVTLRRGERVVREVSVRLTEEGEGTAEIPFTPDELGRAVYRLSIPVAPDDAVPENNERAFLVRVTRDKLRVLLVAGRPSWDVRFLRAFLKRDPTIDLISFFILRSAADLTMASPDELALIPFPTDELFREHLGSFDVVFFQNFDYEPYGMTGYLPRIRDYVRRGGSFAMIGGDKSFGSGGYGQTPLAEILPVEMPPAGTPDTRALVTDRFRPEIVPELSRHPLLELLPDSTANAAAWAGLAPLQGANMLHGTKRDGRTLLRHPRARSPSGEPMPLLVVGTAERGRVLAFGTDTSWRWGMTTGGRRGDASAYERFWDRSLRWLAKDPSLDPCRITTDRERYGPAGKVEVDAIVRDDRYAPLADRAARIRVVDAGGSEVRAADARTDGEGRAQQEIEAPADPGGYRVAVRLADEAEARCEEGFVVEAGGAELADPRPRPELLHALGEQTGGAVYDSPEDAPELGDFDSTLARSLGTVEVAPLSGPWGLVLVVVLFSLEWLMRRRWGKR